MFWFDPKFSHELEIKLDEPKNNVGNVNAILLFEAQEQIRVFLSLQKWSLFSGHIWNKAALGSEWRT